MKHESAISEIIHELARARKAKNYSQSELARQLGMPQSYISRLESGRLDVRLSSLIEIARFLKLEVELVPASAVPIVRSLIGAGRSDKPETPLYNLDDLDEAE